MAQTADILRHIRVATDAAEHVKAGDDSAEHTQRCCDVLKLLQGTPVTADLLASTGAGKAVRKLMQSPDASIKDLAAKVVKVWKASITAQMGAASAAPAGPAAPAAGSAALNTAEGAGSGAGAPPAQQASAYAAPTAASSPVAASVPAPAPAADPGLAHAAAAAPVDGGLQRQASDAPRGPLRAPFRTVPATGDTQRDNIRKGLVAALLLAVVDDYEDVESPHMLAAAIEDALLMAYNSASSAEYKAKARTLLFNLRDKKNPDLRRRVLLGEIPPAILLTMTSEEMASDAKRQENDAIRAAMRKETERTQNVTGNITDMWQCTKCKKRRCTYYQMQTRSADEPMTTFVRCVECNHRWKFC